jgi:hypothetical protein
MRKLLDFQTSDGTSGCDLGGNHFVMNISPEKFEADPATDEMVRLVRDRARDVLQAGCDRARENPIPVVLGALLIGIGVGLLCGRHRSRPKGVGQMARELFGEVSSRISHRLHGTNGTRHWWDQLSGSVRKSHDARF